MIKRFRFKTFLPTGSQGINHKSHGFAAKPETLFKTENIFCFPKSAFANVESANE